MQGYGTNESRRIIGESSDKWRIKQGNSEIKPRQWHSKFADLKAMASNDVKKIKFIRVSWRWLGKVIALVWKNSNNFKFNKLTSKRTTSIILIIEGLFMREIGDVFFIFLRTFGGSSLRVLVFKSGLSGKRLKIQRN